MLSIRKRPAVDRFAPAGKIPVRSPPRMCRRAPCTYRMHTRATAALHGGSLYATCTTRQCGEVQGFASAEVLLEKRSSQVFETLRANSHAGRHLVTGLSIEQAELLVRRVEVCSVHLPAVQ